MQTIYQLRWMDKGVAKYAAFLDKELAEHTAAQVSKMYKSLENKEIKFEANEVGLFEDAHDLIESLVDHWYDDKSSVNP